LPKKCPNGGVKIKPLAARPSNDPKPPASRTPSCGKDRYLSSLSNCGVVVVCKLYFII
jgi:hypothetical protein